MIPLEALAILCAGIAAGTINTIVGSGSLITFPTLLAFGYHPSTRTSPTRSVWSRARSAARSDTGASWSASGRGLPAGHRIRCGRADRRHPPARLPGRVRGHRPGPDSRGPAPRCRGASALEGAGRASPRRVAPVVAADRSSTPRPFTAATFGAGMGIIMIALLTIFVPDDSATAQRPEERPGGIDQRRGRDPVHPAVAPVHWDVALLIAAGSIVGGQVGARVGRRLPAPPCG
jgi:hypothetical protein